MRRLKIYSEIVRRGYCGSVRPKRGMSEQLGTGHQVFRPRSLLIDRPWTWLGHQKFSTGFSRLWKWVRYCTVLWLLFLLSAPQCHCKAVQIASVSWPIIGIFSMSLHFNTEGLKSDLYPLRTIEQSLSWCYNIPLAFYTCTLPRVVQGSGPLYGVGCMYMLYIVYLYVVAGWCIAPIREENVGKQRILLNIWA